jgi:hypothetical protein
MGRTRCWRVAELQRANVEAGMVADEAGFTSRLAVISWCVWDVYGSRIKAYN